MSEKEKGLYQKYEVKKLSNPDKKVDGIVLEFDDPIARDAILQWAESMREAGYVEVCNDVYSKIREQQIKEGCDLDEE